MTISIQEKCELGIEPEPFVKCCTQFYSNLLNVHLEGEPDIPEPGLLEVELAVEKLKYKKLPEQIKST